MLFNRAIWYPVRCTRSMGWNSLLTQPNQKHFNSEPRWIEPGKGWFCSMKAEKCKGKRTDLCCLLTLATDYQKHHVLADCENTMHWALGRIYTVETQDKCSCWPRVLMSVSLYQDKKLALSGLHKRAREIPLVEDAIKMFWWSPLDASWWTGLATSIFFSFLLKSICIVALLLFILLAHECLCPDCYFLWPNGTKLSLTTFPLLFESSVSLSMRLHVRADTALKLHYAEILIVRIKMIWTNSHF